MARPRLKDKDVLRDELVRAADRLIMSEGVGALTARALAQEVGVAVGTTYNVFANMDELVIALNGRTLDRLRDWLAEEPLQRASVEDTLIAFADCYIAFVEAHAALWLVLFEHEYQNRDVTEHAEPSANEQRVSKLFALIEEALAPLFKLPKERSELTRAARVLWAGVHGICHLALTGRLRFMHLDDAGSLARALIRCHIAGLRAGCRG